MKIIETEWESYKTQVIPQGAPQVQLVETRRAFYAGAASLFQALVTKVSDGTEPADADMKMMDSIKAELDEEVRKLEAEVRRNVGRG